MSLLKILLFILLFSSCKQRFQINTRAYIIGNNNIVPVTTKASTEILPAQLMANVILVIKQPGLGRRVCSGTLISGKNPQHTHRILTNHHCFAEETPDKLKVSQNIAEESCANTHVFFGLFQGTADTHELGLCNPGTLRTNPDRDLAVFHLSENPSSQYHPAVLSPNAVTIGLKARVIHYPAALEDILSDATINIPALGLTLPLAHLSEEDCQTLGPFPQDQWDIDPSLKFGFRHSCDQVKGSSGSAIWDIQSGNVIGINWGGISLNFRNPDRTEIFNVSTSSIYALEFLEDEENMTHQVSLSTEGPAKKRTSSLEKANSQCAVLASHPLIPKHSFWLMLLPVIFLFLRSNPKGKQSL